MTNKRTVYGKKLLTAAVLVSMLPGGLAFAEETLPLYTLDAVVVTATRTENDVKNVPASTQIITSSDIKKSGATNVRDAITDFANITMTKKVRGGGHEIIVRGMSTDKSLIMVNGHRVANEADGSGLGNANALDRINVDNIEKIEIVKGPSSALYGSEAMGGVINIITKGSVIVVNEGQCMMIVEQGKVVEICAEPGEYIYDSSTEPTVFGGDLASDLKAVFRNMGKRFTFGGDAPKDQRVYYFNTKEIMGNKYGTPQSIQFESMIGPYMLNVNIRCFGEYSYRIANPILFYTNVCSNFDTVYERSEIDSQLKSELLTALQPAFGRIAAKGIRYTQLINYTKDIRNELSEELSEDWGKKRGIEIVSFGVSSVKAEEEDERRIKEIQDSAIMSNPDMRAGRLATATADAMRTAAGNEAGMGGAFGFMGMGMAGQVGAGAMGAFGQGAPSQGNPLTPPMQQAPASQQAAPPQAQAVWTCSCGHAGNAGKFCEECGKPQPKPASAGWTCSCGTVNKGKFCMECGAKKPDSAPLYKCDKCGWEPNDPKNPPKFCPQCGDPFNDNDVKK